MCWWTNYSDWNCEVSYLVIHRGGELQVSQLMQELLLLHLNVYAVEDTVKHDLAEGDVLHELITGGGLNLEDQIAEKGKL